ncbi:hypothetical protein AQUCO_00400538v1 [Aquilegia coerulea]|uniref:Uncharacterized protein n=1 Tax=Aquilegia coerulea TaxID=218851 RepID=A0A2G5EVG6_AQUCA|nr:hypothetical protein AQUCO_00400538v1 [Aquilegia coerulea]
MVEDEFGNVVGSISTSTNTTSTMNIDPSVVYERGRFYEEYSARRNERLKRKKGVTGQEKRAQRCCCCWSAAGLVWGCAALQRVHCLHFFNKFIIKLYNKTLCC